MIASNDEIIKWCISKFGKAPDNISDISSNGKSKFLRKKILSFGDIVLEHSYTLSIMQYKFNTLFDESTPMFNSFERQMLLKKLERLE